MENGKHKKRMRRARRVETAFYVSVVALPVLNFLVFQFFSSYIYIFVFAVQKYDFDVAKHIFQPDVLYNFRWFLREFFHTPGFASGTANSLLLYGIGWLTMPLGLFIPFYIYKKFPGSKVFKTVLMMPGMVSGMVWVLLYKYLVDRALPVAAGWPYGPLSNVSTQLPALIVYGLWLGMAGSMLLYTGVMSGVSDSVVDAGRIDGMGTLGEFWHISMPALYPVWTVGAVSGIVGIFTGSPSTFEFFGYGAGKETYTIGYLMFTAVMDGGPEKYAFNAAGSILFSLAVLPVTLAAKWALERYGPGEDSREPVKWLWKRRKPA